MRVLNYSLIWVIRCYQCVVSPVKVVLFGPHSHCRFTPSCSDYAIDALRSQGSVRGLWLILKRLVRCHPWGGCGYDPVPPVNRPGGAPVPFLPAAESQSMVLPAWDSRSRIKSG